MWEREKVGCGCAGAEKIAVVDRRFFNFFFSIQNARDAWTSFVAKCELFAGVPAGGAASPASPTRRLTAAADAEGEGEGEGEGDGASLDGQGCFPAFGTAADFGAWLDGTFKEPLRYGKASPVAIASVVVFAGALLSMAAL